MVMIAASGICLKPIHSPTISVQPLEEVHALPLMRKRAHSAAVHVIPPGIALGVRTETPYGNAYGNAMGTSVVGVRSIVEFSGGTGAPGRIRTSDPQIRSHGS